MAAGTGTVTRNITSDDLEVHDGTLRICNTGTLSLNDEARVKHFSCGAMPVGSCALRRLAEDAPTTKQELFTWHSLR